MYRLRTVDVWDTLLRRDCHPECIKLATALHLFLGWTNRLKPDLRNFWSLYRARVDAELRLAVEARSQGGDDEYEITRVLHYWLSEVFSEAAEAYLPAQLAEFELKMEMERSFIDPGITEFLHPHRAELTLFLSDFYMSAAMLRRLLSAKGLQTLVKDGISSCDAGVNKRSGQLFHHVLAIHGVSPEEHIHIGDNLWSDVESPRKVGITALHYLPEAEHAERVERERLFSSREALFEHVRSGCNTLAEPTGNDMSERQTAAFRLGLEAAPLFIGFALWIAEQAVVEKLDRIYFLTREGEFFHQVYSALLPHGMFFGHNLPPSDVLAVSRLATFTASMQDVSVEEMDRIWALFKVQNINGLFTTLGLDVENFASVLEDIGLKVGDVVNDPPNHPAIKRLFQTEMFVNAVNNSIRNQRDVLQDYLEQNGLRQSKRIGVVDIGWRGTIQDNLALLLPQTNIHGMYLGLRRVINSQPVNVSKSAYGPNENQSLRFCAYFENFAAFEMLCSSAEGTVIGYNRIDGLVIPQRHKVDSENDGFFDFTKHFQEGVLRATMHWRPYLERYVVTGGDLHDMALHIWNTLRCEPDKDFVEIFLQTPQHDVFGFGDLFNKESQLPSLSTILLGPFIKSRRRRLIEYVRRVQWSAAIEHVQGVGWFHRVMLILTFRLANWIKRTRMNAQRGRIF